jgi:hypothetical protein
VRFLVLLAAAFLLATFAPLDLQRTNPPPPVTLISFEPVRLYESPDAPSRLGALRFLGGWHLTSNDHRFGGLSALYVEGGEATAFSDSGWVVDFPLPGRGGRARGRINRLEEGPPGSADDKSNRDVEAAVVRSADLWVAYERANEVWRYRRDGLRALGSFRPRAIARWSGNSGAEAMLRLADGRFLLFAEGKGGDSEAALFSSDPAAPGSAAIALRYRPPEGFRITDAALLPDGRILFLNRRVRLLEGFTAKLTVARLPPLAEGAVIGAGDEVATFDGAVTRDNFEALSVTSEGGRTIVWIASDDNYSPLQRTLLLKFALAP